LGAHYYWETAPKVAVDRAAALEPEHRLAAHLAANHQAVISANQRQSQKTAGTGKTGSPVRFGRVFIAQMGLDCPAISSPNCRNA